MNVYKIKEPAIIKTYNPACTSNIAKLLSPAYNGGISYKEVIDGPAKATKKASFTYVVGRRALIYI